MPSALAPTGGMLDLNEGRRERRLDGSDVEPKVTVMAVSILGTAEISTQILAFCVTYANPLLCFQSHTTSLSNCVDFF